MCKEKMYMLVLGDLGHYLEFGGRTLQHQRGICHVLCIKSTL